MRTSAPSPAVILFAFALLAGCDDKKEPERGAPSAKATLSKSTASTASPPPSHGPSAAPSGAAVAPRGDAAAAAGDALELKIQSVGEKMAFDVTEMTVKAGQKVHLTLTNTAKSALMPHNWVLVRPGTEEDVALRGVERKANAYVADADPDVLAASPLVAPLASGDFTFVAPSKPGVYPYICTVPGHYLTMKGTLTVTAR